MHRVAVVVVILVLLCSCSSIGTVHLKTETTGAITWRPCGNVQCGSLSVPLDDTHPAGAHITLALARLPATGRRIGVLFTNPGGPGASGVDFLRDASSVFKHEILKAFDIVSWDTRGVGKSAPVDCGDRLDSFYAVNRDPSDTAGIAENVDATKQFVATCEHNSRPELPYVSTNATVRDLDAIRAAMGEDRISYMGFSYGTYLGTLYADAFPQHVRAMVLDGAIDPALSYRDSTLGQASGFEQALRDFFDWCAHHSECGFAHGSDPRAAYDDLQRMITDEPIPAKVDGESRTLGPGEFDIGVVSALYDGTNGFADLGSALAQAARGTGDQLLQFSDQYTDRQKGGTYSNETAALYAIGCIDGPAPATTIGVEQLAEQARKVAPHFGPTTTWLGLPCTFWPVPAVSKPAPVHANGAPPILVVGNTGDPATPYAWAQALARELSSGHLLTLKGDGHTSYTRGSDCVDKAVDEYLLKLTVPPNGTVCS
jgi:pimeloyl-ACP methyl ester carboxylesterase